MKSNRISCVSQHGTRYAVRDRGCLSFVYGEEFVYFFCNTGDLGHGDMVKVVLIGR